jgi:hypothetical protein
MGLTLITCAAHAHRTLPAGSPQPPETPPWTWRAPSLRTCSRRSSGSAGRGRTRDEPDAHGQGHPLRVVGEQARHGLRVGEGGRQVQRRLRLGLFLRSAGRRGGTCAPAGRSVETHDAVGRLHQLRQLASDGRDLPARRHDRPDALVDRHLELQVDEDGKLR